jgi:hypothetical protein
VFVFGNYKAGIVLLCLIRSLPCFVAHVCWNSISEVWRKRDLLRPYLGDVLGGCSSTIFCTNAIFAQILNLFLCYTSWPTNYLTWFLNSPTKSQVKALAGGGIVLILNGLASVRMPCEGYFVILIDLLMGRTGLRLTGQRTTGKLGAGVLCQIASANVLFLWSSTVGKCARTVFALPEIHIWQSKNNWAGIRLYWKTILPL